MAARRLGYEIAAWDPDPERKEVHPPRPQNGPRDLSRRETRRSLGIRAGSEKNARQHRIARSHSATETLIARLKVTNSFLGVSKS